MVHLDAPVRPVGKAARLRQFIESPAFLALALVLAAVLRLGHLAALRGLPLFDHLVLDSAAYDQWAQRLAAGDWLGGDRAYYQDPLYPYLLGVTYRLLGRDLLVVRLLGAALGVATCGLAGILGRRLGGRAVGNLAALLLAAYRPLVFQDVEVEKTVVGVFLVTAALVLISARSSLARFGAGLAVGLGALTRGNLLALVPFGLLFVLSDPEEASAAAEPGWRARLQGLLAAPGKVLRGRAVRAAVAFAAGLAMALLPVALRNHHVSGEWVLTTSQAGENLYIGNNPSNATGAFALVPFVRSDPAFLEEDFTAAAEARTGRPMAASEVSAYWAGEAWRHVRANPGFAAEVTLRKVLLMVADLELPDAWDPYFLERHSPVLKLPLVGLGVLLVLAAAGVVLGAARGRIGALLLGFAVLYAGSVIPFFVFARYRLLLVPALAVLAAAGLVALAGAVSARRGRAIAGAALAALGAASVSFAVIRPDEPRDNISSWVMLARLYADQGQLPRAAALMEEALRTHPAQEPFATFELGTLALRAGRAADAVRWLERCLGRDEAFPEAWFQLGVALEATGDDGAAARALERQVSLVPGHLPAAMRLAELEIRAGAAGAAAQRMAAAVAVRGEPQAVLLLAVALRAAGQASQAEAVLRQLLDAGVGVTREDYEREAERLIGSASGRGHE